MSFIDKLKQIISGFLATQDNRYITTEDGLRLEIIDLNFNDKGKASSGVWSEKAKIDAPWGDKIKTS